LFKIKSIALYLIQINTKDMTNEGINIQKANITKSIDEEINFIKMLFRSIPKRASRIYRASNITWSEAMKQAWKEVNNMIKKTRKQIAAFTNKLSNLFTPKQFNDTVKGQELAHYEMMNRV
jgi:hypothetical protein